MSSVGLLLSASTAQIILVSIVLPKLAASRISESTSSNRRSSQLLQSFVVLNGFMVLLGVVLLPLLYHLHLNGSHLILSLIICAYFCAQCIPLYITDICSLRKPTRATRTNHEINRDFLASSLALAICASLGFYELARNILMTIELEVYPPVAISIGCQLSAVFFYSISIFEIGFRR
jgi:hypothetical protein